MTPRVLRCALVVSLAGALGASASVRAQESGIPRGSVVERTLVGALVRVNSTVNRILLRMVDGAERELIVTASTKFDGARCPTALFDLPQHTGDDFIVVFTEDRDESTAILIKCFDRDTLKVSEGILTRIDPLTRRMVIRTVYGDQIAFRVADATTFGTGARLVPGATFMAYQGEPVVVYYSLVGEHRIVAHVRLNLEPPNCRLESALGGTVAWPT